MSGLNEIWIFWRDFRNYFMKIRPVGAELFHTDGRTYRRIDRHEANRCFLQFCESALKRP